MMTPDATVKNDCLSIEEKGQAVFELTFDAVQKHQDVVITVSGYPFYALYLNGEFLGSDEFSFRTHHRLEGRLKPGSNSLKVLLVSPAGPGWVRIDSDGPLDLSTNNPAWQRLKNDPLLKHTISPCIRGSYEEPWDGNGFEASDVPRSVEYPEGVVKGLDSDCNILFPGKEFVVPLDPGEHVRFEHEVILDFGRTTLGYPEFELSAPSAGHVTLSFAESFDALDLNPWWHAQDTFHLKRGPNRIQEPQRKGFRYVRLRVDKPGRFTLKNAVNHRPGRIFKNRGHFLCSDPFLNRVNEVSCYTIELCTQKMLEDGVKRDRLLWTGDLSPMASVMYGQLGETEIIREGLYAFAKHQNSRNIIQPSFPWRTGWVMAEYVMWWILALWNYFEYTQDEETLHNLAPIAFEQARWLKSQENERGLFVTRVQDDAPITCWSSRKREGILAYHNFLWVDTKHVLGWLAEKVGYKKWSPSDYKSFSKHISSELLDEHSLWRDKDLSGNLLPEVPLDGNLFYTPYLSGEISSIKRKNHKAIKEQGWTQFGTPIWWQAPGSEPSEEKNRIMPYSNAMEAASLMFWGLWDDGVELLRRCFGHMLDCGATTFWESYELNGHPGSGFVSLCHGWSGYPAAGLPSVIRCMIDEESFVITLTPPEFCPLEWAERVIPYRDEKVYLRREWDQSDRTLRMYGTVPENTPNAFLVMPVDEKSVKTFEMRNCKLDKTGAKDKKAVQYYPGAHLKPGQDFEVTIRFRKSYLKEIARKSRI